MWVVFSKIPLGLPGFPVGNRVTNNTYLQFKFILSKKLSN